MSASAHRYSCDQLGACQSRQTPCKGCNHAHSHAHSSAQAHPYAPGTIERHRRRSWLSLTTPAQRQALKRWLTAAALIATTCAAIGFSAGLYAGA